MPSQEFFAILEMLIYPDVVEPEVLQDDPDFSKDSRARASRACAPFINISPN
jgi:hypothetical protein